MKAFAIILIGIPGIAWATPIQLEHTGRVLDVGGAPIESEVQLLVGLYPDGAVGSTAAWSETISVTPQGGYYTVMLGGDTSGNPLHDTVFDGTPLYLGIDIVGTGPVLPRSLLASVPSAVHATNVSGGLIRAGTGAATCSGNGVEGQVRYTTATGFQGCTPTGWIDFNGSPEWSCATQSTHAGCVSSSDYTSCQDILSDPFFSGGSGAYFIDPDGPGANASPFDVWCDMDTAAGGWTLAGIISSQDGMGAASGCPAELHWRNLDARWEDTTTLNSGAFTDAVDRKFESWSAMSFSDILIVEDVAGVVGHKAWSVGAQASLSAMFGGSCSTLASSALSSGGTISNNNAVIYSADLKVNCSPGDNDDVRLYGSSPGNSDGVLTNGAWGFGVDGDTGSCDYDSEARPSRGGWTNQYHANYFYYTGGSVWSDGGGIDVGTFAGRIYVR